MEFSKLFMYIPGIIIFLVGSGQVRQGAGLFGAARGVKGTVCSCEHVVKKDHRDRDVYNYYNVLVEYTDPATGGKVRRAVKSPTEYYTAQEVTLQGAGSGQLQITGADREPLFPPLAEMIGGALLILLAFWQNDGQERRAMLCLVLILLGSGALLMSRYMRLKRRRLTPIDAEIVDVYARRLTRDTKILMSARSTYYPVVRFSVGGKEHLRRCSVNSSSEKMFPVGDHMKLYYDEDRACVTEAHPQVMMLLAGAVLFALGIAAGAGLLSVL